MPPIVHTGRAAGLLLPLFSMPSTASWGIGEIGDLEPMTAWLKEAGVGVLQLLPTNEMAPGQTSPYSAISAMAIDPIYISLRAVQDFAAIGGEVRLDLADQVALRAVRAAGHVDYETVRRLKNQALRSAFSDFWDTEWLRGTGRAGAFAAFCSWEEWWLADYALYRALRDRAEGRPWTEWDEPLRRRDPDALAQAREALETEVFYHQYLQWLADEQWEDARAKAAPVALFGDFPFMVSTDSADVWARQHLFRFDATVGVPPDAFSATGQDWGLPVYRWDMMERDDYRWLRQRARRSAKLFDGYRIDHLVGFYRTYSRPLDGSEGAFDPPVQDEQIALGERLMGIFGSCGARIIAEDLGIVPDFVRESLDRLDIPGYKVLRWEREWEEPGQPFRDPAGYPVASVATTGTHDTDPLATWWVAADADERLAFARLPQIAPLFEGVDPAEAPFTPELRDATLKALYESPSDLLLIPMQDIFGWTDRINTPATVTAENWTWRLPWPVDQLDRQPEMRERAATLRDWARETARTSPSGETVPAVGSSATSHDGAIAPDHARAPERT
jgi:4-alpha-glucanotransferase